MEKYKYCFLDSVYSDASDGKDAIYELILSSDDFTQTARMYTDTKGLLKLNFSDKSSHLVFDFFIDHDLILKTEPLIETLPLSTFSGMPLNKLHPIVSKFDVTLYDLLVEGATNSFMYIPDDIVQSDTYLGAGFTHFNNVAISSSTMTIMFVCRTEEGFKNFNVVTEEDKDILFKKFYFAIPLDKLEPHHSKYGTRIKNMKINNIDYKIMYTHELPVLVDTMQVSITLANKCANGVSINKTVAKAISLLAEEGMPSKPSSTWVGGTTNHTSNLGVQIIAGAKTMTKKEIENFIDVVKFSILPMVTDDADHKLLFDDYCIINEPQLTLGLQLIQLLRNREDENFSFILIHLLDIYKEEKVLYEVYLHKLRVYLYMNNLRLRRGNIKSLYGSDNNNISRFVEGEYYART